MNGITGWRMQANEPQCLSALLTPPEAKLELLLQQLTAGRCPIRRRCAVILRRNCTVLFSSLR